MDILASYTERYPVLLEAAALLLNDLTDFLKDTPRIDYVRTRAKSIQRYVDKATRVDPNGEKKYQNPLKDVQDQIGARIIVFYPQDVDKVREKIKSVYGFIEDMKREDPDPERFGYQAHHFVCFVPPEILKKTGVPVTFFELQISTLFQHAWAEANHDLGYKTGDPLSYDAKRMIALASAQAWGADRIFDELSLNGNAKFFNSTSKTEGN